MKKFASEAAALFARKNKQRIAGNQQGEDGL